MWCDALQRSELPVNSGDLGLMDERFCMAFVLREYRRLFAGIILVSSLEHTGDLDGWSIFTSMGER
jgi:hypothetical protein